MVRVSVPWIGRASRTIPAPIASSAENGIFRAQNVSANPGAKACWEATNPLRASQPTSRTQRNDISCNGLFVLTVIWRSPMDDYDGRLNFLALVGVALFLSVVVIGFSGHDNGQMDAVKTASIVVPVTAQVK
jgi:hypothetical protein